jgi:hypothetical protein
MPRGTALAATVVLGCGGGSGPPPGLPGTQPPPCPLASRYYAVDDVGFPRTDDEWSRVGFDLDGDGQDDDQLSRSHWYFSQEIAIPSAERIRGLVSAWIVEVSECEDGTLDHARVALHEGTRVGDQVELPDPMTMPMTMPAAVPAVGVRSAGIIFADQGIATAPVPAMFELDLLDPSPWLRADGTTFRLEATDAEVTGAIAFGVEAGAARDLLAVRFAQIYSRLLELAPDCTPTSGLCSVLGAVALMLDDDGDRIVTPEELMRDFPNRFGQQILEADADLLTDGEYWPGHDGTIDSFSIAFTLHAAPVTVVLVMPP